MHPEITIKRSLTNHIKRFRLAHDLSVRALGKAVHCGGSTISRWELGQSEVPDSAKLALAEFFKVQVPTIFEFHYDVSNDVLHRLLDEVTGLRSQVVALESEVGLLRGAA